MNEAMGAKVIVGDTRYKSRDICGIITAVEVLENTICITVDGGVCGKSMYGIPMTVDSTAIKECRNGWTELGYPPNVSEEGVRA